MISSSEQPPTTRSGSDTVQQQQSLDQQQLQLLTVDPTTTQQIPPISETPSSTPPRPPTPCPPSQHFDNSQQKCVADSSNLDTSAEKIARPILAAKCLIGQHYLVFRCVNDIPNNGPLGGFIKLGPHSAESLTNPAATHQTPSTFNTQLSSSTTAPSTPVLPSQPECTPGYQWDNSQQKCVADLANGPK